jgi:hypothetical protein
VRERQKPMHVEAGDLVRLMDGEVSSDERETINAHLAECAECGARRETLQRQSAAIAELLRSIDVAPPATPLRLTVLPAPGSSARRWRLVAAVTLLAVAGSIAVPPVRAWIANVARMVWAKMAGGRSADITPMPPSGPTDAGAVSFVPAGSILTIRVPSRPGARLIIETVDGDRATAMGVAGKAIAGLVVLPEELRLGQPSAATDYLVRVPARLDQLRLIIGNEQPRTLRPGRVGERTVILL